MNDNWGHAARFGIFIVGSEVVPEAEWWAMAPRGVSIHAARVTASAPWAQWQAGCTAVDLAPDLERGVRQFAAMRLAAVVVAHSSSSVAGGPGWDDAVTAQLKTYLADDTKVTTNGSDCVHALRHCGVERPFVVFPPWFNDDAIPTGIAYFSAHGFTPPRPFRHRPEGRWEHIAPGDLYKEFMHVQQREDLLMDQIVANCPVSADGVLIVGTGLRCVGMIDALEQKIARPVVTANQASLWRCLGLAGINARIEGYGQLLAGSRVQG